MNLTDTLSKAVAAFVSVGAVVVLGGAVAYARYDAAELPANQVVALIGRSELIVSGANALTAFVVAGLLALACAYALDDEGKTSQRTVWGLMVIAVVEVAFATLITLDGWERWVAFGAPVAALFLLVLVPRDRANTRAHGIRAWLRRQGMWPEGWAIGSWWLLGVVLSVLLIPLVAVAVVGLAVGEGNSYFPLAYLAAAVGLAILCYRIATATANRFLWYGVSVFVAVVLFGAGMSLLRTYYAPKLQPAAAVLTFKTDRVLRKGEEPVPVQSEMSGIYIAETDNRLYFGLVDALRPPDSGEEADIEGKDQNAAVEGSGSIFWVSCDQVVSYAVGPPARVDVAIYDQVKVLLEDLNRQPNTEPDNVPPVGKTTTDPDGTVTTEPAATPAGTCKDD